MIDDVITNEFVNANTGRWMQKVQAVSLPDFAYPYRSVLFTHQFACPLDIYAFHIHITSLLAIVSAFTHFPVIKIIDEILDVRRNYFSQLPKLLNGRYCNKVWSHSLIVDLLTVIFRHDDNTRWTDSERYCPLDRYSTIFVIPTSPSLTTIQATILKRVSTVCLCLSWMYTCLLSVLHILAIIYACIC